MEDLSRERLWGGPAGRRIPHFRVAGRVWADAEMAGKVDLVSRTKLQSAQKGAYGGTERFESTWQLFIAHGFSRAPREIPDTDCYFRRYPCRDHTIQWAYVNRVNSKVTVQLLLGEGMKPRNLASDCNLDEIEYILTKSQNRPHSTPAKKLLPAPKGAPREKPAICFSIDGVDSALLFVNSVAHGEHHVSRQSRMSDSTRP